MVKGILVNRKVDEAQKAQLKMDHVDLVAEMQTIENLPTQERLQLARYRRAQQLKVARQKEKEWLKVQRAKGNPVPPLSGNTTHHFRLSNGSGGSGGKGRTSRHISFESSVVLLEAASRNDMQEVAELLERGITPDAANEDGLTALHQCCIDNNVEMLRLLLQFGANVDAQDSDKWTPLHAAATCGHLDLVRILIDHGANLLAVNTDGNMPYDLCDDENTLDYIEAEMSKRGVTQELIDETRSSTERKMLDDLSEVVRLGGDLEQSDYQSATPLHIAAANGYVRVVEFLLEMHVNVDALDKDMWSPVHAAACWGHLEVLEMLAQCGADLNVRNKDNETPSDICEDPEIRERIEQLKTEQESKRLAEAQRRRVRRSQSNNTRAQSVRRTSLRDKTLTTKKDAVEEARLRMQAQEVFVPTDSAAKTPPNNNNNTTIHNMHAASPPRNGTPSDAVDATTTTTMAAAAMTATHSHLPRRPPDGRENDELPVGGFKGTNGGSEHLRASNSSTSSAAAAAAAAVVVSDRKAMSAAEAVQVQSSKKEANGKINVQVTVLVDTTNTHHHHQPNQTNIHTNSPPMDASSSALAAAATLANLKKQRSLSRTTPAFSNYENGSILGASTTTTTNTTTNPHNNNNNNNNNNGAMGDGVGVIGCGYNPGSSSEFHSIGDSSSFGSVNKFCGVPGDVVSDSTRSKKCCALM